MIKIPSPGVVCPPLATMFGSLRSEIAARANAIKMPISGPRNKIEIARKTFGIAVANLMELLLFPSDADPFFHLIEVLGEGAAAGRGEAIFGAGDAAFKK